MAAVIGAPSRIPARAVDAGATEPAPGGPRALPAVGARAALQAAMTRDAGVVRTRASLERAAVGLAQPVVEGPGAAEVRNLVAVGRALVASALVREESRGNHWRADHPLVDDRCAVRLVHNHP
jgi:L-aspartate oxidase